MNKAQIAIDDDKDYKNMRKVYQSYMAYGYCHKMFIISTGILIKNSNKGNKVYFF